MKAFLRKPIKKTEREKKLEEIVAKQKKEIKFQAAALNEVNVAVNAVLSSILTTHGRKNENGDYVLYFPKPDINDGYEVKTVVVDNGFYCMTARKVDNDDCEPDDTETAQRNGEAAEKAE